MENCYEISNLYIWVFKKPYYLSTTFCLQFQIIRKLQFTPYSFIIWHSCEKYFCHVLLWYTLAFMIKRPDFPASCWLSNRSIEWTMTSLFTKSIEFYAYKLKRWLKSRWVVQKFLRWNVLVWFDAHAVLFALALLSGSFYKRSG